MKCDRMVGWMRRMMQAAGLAILCGAIFVGARAQSVLDILATHASLTNSRAAIAASTLVTEILATNPGWTFLAPTDEAFARLPQEVRENLFAPANAGNLTRLLLYHVIPSFQTTTNLPESSEIRCYIGDFHPVSTNWLNGARTIRSAEISIPDLIATNGVVQGIDMVLFPPSDPPVLGSFRDVIASDGRFATYLAAIRRNGLQFLNDAGPYSILAPSDQAFGNLDPLVRSNLFLPANRGDLTLLLLKHLVPSLQITTNLSDPSTANNWVGETMTFTTNALGVWRVNGIEMMWPDRPASNGVVHGLTGVVGLSVAPTNPPPVGLSAALRADGRFTNLLAAVAASGVDALDLAGPFTLFAPTDSAFAELPAGALAELLLPANQERLRSLLRNHLVVGGIPASGLSGILASVGNVPLVISGSAPNLKVNEAPILPPEIVATNGFVHAISKVLAFELPPPAVTNSIAEALAKDGRFGTLLSAVTASGLSIFSESGPYTLFAPTDSAFAALPPGTLTDLLVPANAARLLETLRNHVVVGDRGASNLAASGTLTSLASHPLVFTGTPANLNVNGNPVTPPEIPATNGRIHALAGVLIPPPVVIERTNTLVRVLRAAAGFSTFVKAVEAAGLESELNDLGRLRTILAPTDAAFSAFPSNQLAQLLLPANVAELRRFLQTHLLAGSIPGSTLRDRRSITNEAGAKLNLIRRDTNLFVNAAKVLQFGVPADNGLIHSLDRVLVHNPESITLADLLAADGRFGLLLTTMQITGFRSALGSGGPFTVMAVTDETLDAFPPDSLEGSLRPDATDTTRRFQVLTHSIVRGRFDRTALAGVSSVTSALGEPVSVNVADGSLVLGGRQVVGEELKARNGVIHIVASTVLPPSYLATQSMGSILRGNGNFKTLFSLLPIAARVDLFDSPGRVTVLAPLDAAFSKLPPQLISYLLRFENFATTEKVIFNHVVTQPDTVNNFIANGRVGTFAGTQIHFSNSPAGPMVSGARFLSTDQVASNGIVNQIDSVLLPFSLPLASTIGGLIATDPRSATLSSLLDLAEVAESLRTDPSLTLFAPTEAAFAKLPPATLESLRRPENRAQLRDLLLYHVAPGNIAAAGLPGRPRLITLNGRIIDVTGSGASLRVNGAALGPVDFRGNEVLTAGNGVIHFIDSVLLPPQPDDVLQILTADGRFRTLLSAITAAGLSNDIVKLRNVTFLAPPDSAFAKLPAGVLATLLQPANRSKLRDILLYHIVPAQTPRSLFVNISLAFTLHGKNLVVTNKADGVYVENARLVETDQVAANGLLHIIDQVLLPEPVLPAVPLTLSFTVNETRTRLQLIWEGGVPPYTIQQRSALNLPWADLLQTDGLVFEAPTGQGSRFYRIRDGSSGN